MRIFLAGLILLIISEASFAQPRSEYPKVDIDGYKKWEYRRPSVTPGTQFFTGITHLGYYPTLTGGDLQERLQLRINGEFSEETSLAGEFEQQPELPDQFKVKAIYQNTQLEFGNINASFTGNEFASASKFIDGMMLKSTSDWYDFTVVPSSKLRSNTQKVTTQKGNNTPGPYSLGHNSIVEGTEHIELNNRVLRRGEDYQMDYFNGRITFNRILTPDDEIRYSYEYTGLLDLFFPVLSKRDFFGVQGRVKLRPGMLSPKAPPSEKWIQVGEEEWEEPDMELGSIPIVPGSETVSFRGRVMEPGIDYRLDKDTGKMEWLWPESPTEFDRVAVRYEYYKTAAHREEIAGNDSKGPYFSAKKPILPESLLVKLDRIPLRRGVDYSLDPLTGQLVFVMPIDSNSTLLLEYNAYELTAPPAYPKLRGLQPEITVGTTYLRESAQSGRVNLLNNRVEVVPGSFFASGGTGNAISLSDFPIAPTTEAGAQLDVSVSGTPLVFGVDYTVPTVEVDALGNARRIPDVELQFINDPQDVSDGYDTGTLFFFDPLQTLGRSILATEEVIVAYTYRKTTAGRYVGSGNGTRGNYYLTGHRGIVPGSETIQITDGGVLRALTRNSSPTIQDGDYNFNYSDPDPYIFFNDELATGTGFTVTFRYVPDSQIESSQLSHSVLGVDGGFTIGDFMEIRTDLASSTIDQLFVEESGTFTATGNGTRRYTINAPGDLIDGSEKVIMNGLYVLNRDVDYFINYTRPGLLVFFFVTPGTQDAISVDYRYQSATGIAGGTRRSTGTSHKMSWKFKPSQAVRYSGDIRSLNPQFRPLGTSGLGSGSDWVGNRLEISPIQNVQVVADWKDRKDQIGTSQGFFQKQTDQSYAVNFVPEGVGDFSLSYRTLRSNDNALELPGTPFAQTQDSDAKYHTLKYQSPTWRRGIFSLTNGLNFTRTDTDNNLANLFQRTEFYALNSGLGVTERFGVDLGYQVSEPLSRAMGSAEATSHRKAVDLTYGIKSDFTREPIKKLAGQLKFTHHDEDDLVARTRPISTRNANYILDFVPVTPLALNANHNRNEQISVVGGAANPTSERTTWSARFTPLTLLSLNYKTSVDNAVQASGATNQGNTGGYGIQYNLLNTPFIQSTLRYQSDDRKTQVTPASTTPVTNVIDNLTRDAGMALTLIPFGLINITGDIAVQEYRNYTRTVTAETTTVPVETQNVTYKVSTSVQPRPPIQLTASYSSKQTNDLLTNSAPLPKSILETQLTYRISTWGNLVVQLQNEDNQGEVAGGRLTGLTFLKTTRVATFTFLIPSDNPLLSRAEGNIAFRNVNYQDRQAAGNSFDATLISAEFTLTF